MNFENINIGHIIENEVRNQGISDKRFSELIGVFRQNIKSSIYGKKSIDTDKLMLISKVLNVNFFSYFTAYDGNKNNDTKCVTEVNLSIKVPENKLPEMLRWISENSNVKIEEK